MIRAKAQAAEIRHKDIVHSLDRALLVLNGELYVEYANLAYYRLTGTLEEDTVGEHVSKLWAGAFDDPRLMPLLEGVIPYGMRITAFDIEQTFPVIGRRVLRLNAQEIAREAAGTGFLLLTIGDITSDEQIWRRTGRELDRITAMIDEVHHRVKNNIAAITSMIRLESRQLADPEARSAFERVASRIDYLATLYELLAVKDKTGEVELLQFFKRICDSIEKMSKSANAGWTIRVIGDEAEATIDDAVRIGAIVHELVANAAKYAFESRQDIGLILVECIRKRDRLIIKVSDNGCGIAEHAADPKSTGLGMRIVSLYLDQMGGDLTRETDPQGTRYAVTLPLATPGSGEDVIARPRLLSVRL